MVSRRGWAEETGEIDKWPEDWERSKAVKQLILRGKELRASTVEMKDQT